MIHIENQGAEIARTNYWETPHAQRGYCYLSGNAGVWRLLVPKAQAALIADMRTGQRATLEPSLQTPSQCWDLVFEDGSDSPFSPALDKRQVVRALDARPCCLAVWTPQGRVLKVHGTVKI